MGDWDYEDRRDQIREKINEQISKGTRPKKFGILLKKSNFDIGKDLNDMIYEHYNINFGNYYIDVYEKTGKYEMSVYNKSLQKRMYVFHENDYFSTSNIDDFIEKIKYIMSLKYN